jgi:hypothetical protein
MFIFISKQQKRLLLGRRITKQTNPLEVTAAKARQAK